MLFKRIHRYLGLLLCLIMLSISLTGCLLIWKPEYLWLTIYQARETQNHESGFLVDAIESIEKHHPSGSIKLIQIFSENLALHKVFLSNQQYAWHDQRGDLVQQWGSKQRIEDWLLDLHHRFLLGDTIGLNIAGFGGLLLIPLILMGLFIWWPRRRFLKIGVIPKSVRHGSLIGSHSNLGFLSIIPILIVSISGVILVYPTQARNILLPKANNNLLASAVVKHTLPITNWSDRLATASSLYPQSKIRWVSPATVKYPNVSVGLQQVQAWNRMGNTTLSFMDGTLTSNQNALARSTALRLMDFTFPLHTGKLDLWYRLLLTVFGLLLGSVSVLGLTCYIRRRIEQKV
ncbi:MAG: putative iron-regulated membrane protein [Parvicella sp.]